MVFARFWPGKVWFVTANDTLLTLLWQVDPIWVQFNISENEQLALNRAVAAGKLVLPKDNAYDVTIKLADGSVFPRKGRINFSDTRVNPATGTYEMRAEIANADGALKPGQFARVQLKGAVRSNAIAVPQVAVMDGAQGKFVYVTGKDKDGKDIAVVRPIVQHTMAWLRRATSSMCCWVRCRLWDRAHMRPLTTICSKDEFCLSPGVTTSSPELPVGRRLTAPAEKPTPSRKCRSG